MYFVLLRCHFRTSTLTSFLFIYLFLFSINSFKQSIEFVPRRPISLSKKGRSKNSRLLLKKRIEFLICMATLTIPFLMIAGHFCGGKSILFRQTNSKSRRRRSSTTRCCSPFCFLSFFFFFVSLSTIILSYLFPFSFSKRSKLGKGMQGCERYESSMHSTQQRETRVLRESTGGYYKSGLTNT